MEKIKSIIGISELIAREMSGELNQAEKELLVEWLESAERNREIYTQIVEGHNLSERNRIYQSVDVEKGWNKISGSLTSRSKKRMIHRFIRYAAAVLLPILVGITSYWYLNDQPSQLSETMAVIQPGSANAVLILANGKRVSLSDNVEQSLVEKDGTMIVNNGDELSYAGGSGKIQQKVLLNTLIVPKGGEYNLVLSDGSRVLVNSMSKLVFPVRFSGNIRELSLEEGEAYFEVSKDKSRPFIVKVKGVQVEVLGTSFNIKAYANDRRLYTTLIEGKVKLTDDQSDRAYFLTPDQQAVYDSESAGITVQKVDALQFVQWTKGRYLFTNESLDEIMKTLSRWYDFNYRYEEETLKQIKFEGGLNKYESLNPILDIISGTGKVKVEIQGKDVLFKRDQK